MQIMRLWTKKARRHRPCANRAIFGMALRSWPTRWSSSGSLPKQHLHYRPLLRLPLACVAMLVSAARPFLVRVPGIPSSASPSPTQGGNWPPPDCAEELPWAALNTDGHFGQMGHCKKGLVLVHCARYKKSSGICVLVLHACHERGAPEHIRLVLTRKQSCSPLATPKVRKRRSEGGRRRLQKPY